MAMLEVKDLEVYYGVIQALKGISFDVDQGDIVALIGANGAGKTTTLHTITGLLNAKAGKIIYEGKDITDWLVVAYDDENAELAGYTSREGTWTPDVNDPDDSHTEVEMRLPLGKYSFYAFANLQSLEDGTSLYQKITGAHSLAELSEVKILDSGTSIDTRNEEKKGKFGGEEASRKRIPMSSYAQEYTLKPAPAENKFEIPLIRMIGKVQVKITNNLDKPITVKQLDIMNLRKGSLPIWLLPWGNNKYLETAGEGGAERLPRIFRLERR